jgi:sec-independent protein translocase protein TatA
MFAFLEGPELLIVLAILVLVFGASQLPKLARSFGQAQREFKNGLADAPADKGDSSG